MREKLIELPRQLRYCAADKDCRNCERRNVSCGSRYCVDDLMLKAAELLESIANGVTIQRWIPVSEGLPEDGSNVLAYLRVGEEGRIYPANYAKGVWWDCIFSTPATKTTTHWMPLPQPPKEGE